MEKYCGRPANFEDLISANLRVVNKSDILIHLGDISMGVSDSLMHERYIESLIHIRGK